MLLWQAIQEIKDPVQQLSASSALANPALRRAIEIVIENLHKQFPSIDLNSADEKIAQHYRIVKSQLIVYQELHALVTQLISETAKR